MSIRRVEVLHPDIELPKPVKPAAALYGVNPVPQIVADVGVYLEN